MAIKKYFLNRNGIETLRLQGKPGAGHVEIATAVLKAGGRFQPDLDVYDQMARFGFARCREDDDTLDIEFPRALSAHQKRFLDAKRAEGKKIRANYQPFIQARKRIHH